MNDPIRAALFQAQAALRLAARSLGCPAEPTLELIRFRADGKGGELASPFPMVAGLDSAALAQGVVLTDLLEAVYPSGGWIAFNLSEDWRALVRSWQPDWTPPALCPPPQADFPARIDAASWRFCALLGRAEPALAARLDLGNPYRRLLRAEGLARAGQGENGAERHLVNCAAACRNAASLLALADAYLARPAEDALVAKALAYGRKTLGI